MAKYTEPRFNSCQHCGTYFSFEQWYDEPSLMDRGNIQRARTRVIPNCSCPYPVALTNSNLQPATRKEPTVTEKQYSTDPTKNAKLKAVSEAFQTVEETLLTNTIEATNAATRATSLLNNSLQRLDRELLAAGQAGITLDELSEAFPADDVVLTERMETVWNKVSVDKLENVS